MVENVVGQQKHCARSFLRCGIVEPYKQALHEGSTLFLGTFVDNLNNNASSVFFSHSVSASVSQFNAPIQATAMAELQSKPETAPAPAPVVAEVPSNDAVATEGCGPDESKALVVRTEEAAVPENKQSWRASIDRDIARAEVERAKKLSYVKAWEESEKAKVDNRANKHLSAVAAWEDKKMAALEAELKKIEEQLEKKKAEHGEKMKNRMALVHKEAEEKRARIEAKRGEEVLKAEEIAARYRATGTTPKKTIGCF